MSDDPKNISVEVREGRFRQAWRAVMSSGDLFLAEVHRDDGSWSYGLGNTRAEAISDANQRLDGDDPLHDYIEV